MDHASYTLNDEEFVRGDPGSPVLLGDLESFFVLLLTRLTRAVCQMHIIHARYPSKTVLHA